MQELKHKWRGNELKYWNVNGNYLFHDAWDLAFFHWPLLTFELATWNWVPQKIECPFEEPYPLTRSENKTRKWRSLFNHNNRGQQNHIRSMGKWCLLMDIQGLLKINLGLSMSTIVYEVVDFSLPFFLVASLDFLGPWHTWVSIAFSVNPCSKLSQRETLEEGVQSLGQSRYHPHFVRWRLDQSLRMSFRYLLLSIFWSFQIRKRGGKQGVALIRRSPKLKYLQKKEWL
jgi:hypothetical protein